MPSDFGEQIVDEGQQLRHRAEAARDRSARALARAQALDERAGLLQHRDLRVSEAVDRLLAVADDEDRGIRREPKPLAP